MKYCRYCGKPIDDDSTFCTHCGKGQNVQNSTVFFGKIGSIVSSALKEKKELKGKSVRPNYEGSDSSFVHIKKWIKRISVVLIVAAIIGLLVLLVLWLYCFYKTSKWTRDEERCEIIVMKDISKADSIARVFFQEYAEAHRFGLYMDWCGDSHIEKGIEILRNAAERGDADAQFTLGCIYAGAHYEFRSIYFTNGYTMLGEEVDINRAAYWYTLSANQGHRIALYNLGKIYKNGMGLKKDLAKATEYIRKSAEQGYSDAQLVYGDMFRDGEVLFRTEPDSISGESFLINVKPNIERAKEWWEKALKNGNDNAKSRLEKIYE